MFSKPPRLGATFLFSLLIGAVLLLPRIAPAQAPAVLLNPANGHYYEGVAVGGGGLNWAAAKAAAEARSYLGTPGHLVTITSAAEKQFVNSSFPTAVGNSWWLGGFQPAGSAEPSGGWQWVTGEPWSYISWGSGEPNNSANKENALQYAGGGSGNWNDVDGTFLYGGYIVEYDVPAGPAPTAPTSLSATAVSATRVDLSWTHPSAGTVGFKIERRQGTDSYTEIGQVSAVSTYSDTTAGPGISYVYRVRAVNGGGTSPYSPEASATTPLSGTPVLNTANGHYYLAVAAPASTITWADAEAAARATRFNGVFGHLATLTTAAENAFVTNTFPNAVSGHWILGGFQVLGTGEPLGTWQWLTGETWSYTNWNTGEPNNTNSDEDVLSFLNGGRWNDAELFYPFGGYVIEFEPGSAPPDGAPSNLSATVVSAGQVNVTWADGSTNETGFHVERRTGTGPWRPLVILPANTAAYNDNSTAANTSYTYRVRAITPGGESANSNEAVAAAAPDPIDQISFSGPTNYSVPTETGVIEVSDLDGDGRLDLIVCNGDSVSLYYGHGDGTFDPAATTRVGAALSQAIGADVNNDGRPDLIASAANDNQVDVLINLGNRSFAAPARYTAGANPWGVTAGDFNKDGWLDLALPNDGSSNMCVFLNQRNGTFGAATFYAGSTTPAKVAAADFDGDGNLDLAMSNYVSGNVLIYRGNGTGGFMQTANLGVGEYPAQLVVDDFNHDGKLDIATANTFSHNVSVLMGNGTGGFGAAAFYPGNTYPHLMRSADLDGDGWADLVFPNNGTDYFSVLRNRRNGLFSGPRRFTSGGHNVRMLAVGDFNGDGRVDVAAGNAQEFTVSIFLNTTPGPGPRPATSLSATAASTSSINLTWTRSADSVTGYKIQRRSGGAFVQVGLAGATAAGFTDSGLQPDTVYTYRVLAYNGSGDSLPSNEASATTQRVPPNAPSGLTATAVSSGRVDLQWVDGSSDEEAFEIERAVGNAAFLPLAAVGVNATTYSDTSVGPSTTYTYRVQAVAGSVASGFATSAPVTTPAPPPSVPAPPTNLTAAAMGQTEIDLSWTDASSNEDGFHIERSTDGITFAPRGQRGAGQTTYADTGLTAGTTYFYRVRAYNTGGESNPSNVAQTTTAPNAPDAPSGLRVTARGQTTLTLEWTAPVGALRYEVERRIGNAFVRVGTSTDPSYTDTGLSPNTNYTYQVRALNAGGFSDYTTSLTTTTLPGVPPAPDNLQAAAASRTSIRVTWGAPAGPLTGYLLERSADGGGSWVAIGPPPVNQSAYLDQDLEAGTTYQYRLRARTDGGDGPYAGPVSATTLPPLPAPPAVPQNLRVAGLAATSIQLAWDASVGATSYAVERKTGTGTFTPRGTVEFGTSYTDVGVAPGLTYVYRVKATNPGGDSDFSSTVSATIPPGGKLKLSTKSLKFGTVTRGRTLQKSLTVSNRGKGSLVVTVASLQNGYAVVLGGGTFTLRAGQSQKVTVRFAPTAVGPYNTTLPITSTDPASSAVAVQLSGIGK